MKFFLICVAGGLGTGARYLLSGFAASVGGANFPYGTLTVNALGSFLMGFTVAVSVASDWIAPDVRVILTVGFLGGFTTYSSFNQDTLHFFQNGEFTRGLGNIAGMLLVCLAGGALGMVLASNVSRMR